jgi:hypothetical protein
MFSEGQLAASIGHKFDGARAVDPTVIDDFLFLDAWERGLLPSLSALLRARQIRRANVARAVRLAILERSARGISAIRRRPDDSVRDS